MNNSEFNKQQLTRAFEISQKMRDKIGVIHVLIMISLMQNKAAVCNCRGRFSNLHYPEKHSAKNIRRVFLSYHYELITKEVIRFLKENPNFNVSHPRCILLSIKALTEATKEYKGNIIFDKFAKQTIQQALADKYQELNNQAT